MKKTGIYAAVTGGFLIVLTGAASMLAGSDAKVPEQNVSDSDSFIEALSYTGYLDESLYTYWNERDWGRDYDGDGITDRIYRSYEDSTCFISYRIEFADEKTEPIVIGPFADMYTDIKLESADLTGDGVPEILFVGSHVASTDPASMSEIALYGKMDDSYIQIPLPTPSPEHVPEDNRYLAGYELYVYDNGDDTVRLTCPDAGWEVTIALGEEYEPAGEAASDGETATRYTMVYGEQKEACPAGECAFDAAFAEVDGTMRLLLYENSGGKWLYQPVLFVLAVNQAEHASGTEAEGYAVELTETLLETQADFPNNY